ncbi:hypothetical protein PBY51_022250 [Eleginops maclovinus]|uniref:Uncharacterized protein n=1 Tax=Eleginops maclovinus TaxID=56733 RepID=A0AAN7XCN3_ELEMC|nr:hypothetical protein PBY51_022250 [Eleginops maclovinus]
MRHQNFAAPTPAFPTTGPSHHPCPILCFKTPAPFPILGTKPRGFPKPPPPPPPPLPPPGPPTLPSPPTRCFPPTAFSQTPDCPQPPRCSPLPSQTHCAPPP